MIWLAVPAAALLYLLARSWRQETAADRVPILVYHRLVLDSQPAPPFAISAGRFRRQMEDLLAAGYRTLTLPELFGGGAAAIRREGLRPLVITFDDGWESVERLAAPILRELGMRATVFATADPADPVFAEAGDEDRSLSADQLRRMAGEGFSIESHSFSHQPLSAMPAAAQLRQMADSRRVLEEITGRPVGFLAAPYGLSNRRSFACARQAGYLGFCPGAGGVGRERISPYRLRRLRGDRAADICRALSPWYAWRARLAAGIKNPVRRLLGQSRVERWKQRCSPKRSQRGAG